MGFKTASTRRTTAASAVSSQAVVINSGNAAPAGTTPSFSVAGSTIQANSVISLNVVVVGQNSASSTTTISSGPNIANIQYLDTNNNIVSGQTAVSTTAGGNILITGTGFIANSNVYVNNSLVTNTFISTTQVRAILPTGSSGNVSLYMFTPTNSGGISPTPVRYSGAPTWTTSTGVFQNGSAGNITLLATSDSALTFTLQAGSTLPTGISLLSTGYLTGTPTGYTLSTIFTPVIIATDAEGQATQQTITLTVSVADPQFPVVSFLSKTTGVNTANNSVIVDNSSNNLAITVTGTPAQGMFSPFSLTGWSNYFNGTTDYLTTASVALTTVNTNTTHEMWVYPTQLTNATRYFVIQGFVAVSLIGLPGDKTANVEFWINSFAAPAVTTALTVPINTWTHIAVVRNSNVNTIYVNGVADATTNTNGIAHSAGVYYVSYYGAGTNGWFSGYISNFRFLSGTAQYTTNFSPPTAPLTAITNTRLLTCNDNRFRDGSSNAYTVTPSGTPSVQAKSPFSPSTLWSAATYGGSGFFNGTTDIVRATVGTAPGTLFTIEGWCYLTAFNTGSPNVFSIVASGSSTGFQVFASATSWGARSNTSTIINYTAIPPKLNQWYHVALVRSSSTLTTLYINGVSVGTSATNYTFSDTTFQIGQAPIGQYFAGYITNVRYVAGAAVYTTTFTPPTSPVAEISGTGALMNFTNAGVYDGHSTIDLLTVGNAQASTAQKKYANASIAFDGTGDYLVGIANAVPIANYTGQFTIEGWAYYNTLVGPQYLVDTRANATSTTGIAISSNAAGYLAVTMNNTTVITASTSFTSNAWVHWAVARSSANVVSCYINGSNVGGAVSTTTLSDTSLLIGTSIANKDTSSTNHFNGYLEDVRLTTGFARYTANFTPPTTAMPTQ